jgi:hypothetical protein
MSDAADHLARTRLAIIAQLHPSESVDAEELGDEAAMLAICLIASAI